jgi:hypothetical protein
MPYHCNHVLPDTRRAVFWEEDPGGGEREIQGKVLDTRSRGEDVFSRNAHVVDVAAEQDEAERSAASVSCVQRDQHGHPHVSVGGLVRGERGVVRLVVNLPWSNFCHLKCNASCGTIGLFLWYFCHYGFTKNGGCDEC